MNCLKYVHLFGGGGSREEETTEISASASTPSQQSCAQLGNIGVMGGYLGRCRLSFLGVKGQQHTCCPVMISVLIMQHHTRRGGNAVGTYGWVQGHHHPERLYPPCSFQVQLEKLRCGHCQHVWDIKWRRCAWQRVQGAVVQQGCKRQLDKGRGQPRGDGTTAGHHRLPAAENCGTTQGHLLELLGFLPVQCVPAGG